MITGYFGVPGCGKTTILARIAQKELRRIRKGKSCYDHVLTNFFCEGCEQIQLLDLKDFKVKRCLILLDEVTLDADSRSFKSFPLGVKEFIIMHRHVFCDIVYFCQDYSRVDKTFRELTSDLWYCRKPVLPFFRRFTICRKIFRNISINEFTSDLVLGYRFSKFLERIFMCLVQKLFTVLVGISILILLMKAALQIVLTSHMRNGIIFRLLNHYKVLKFCFFQRTPVRDRAG